VNLLWYVQQFFHLKFQITTEIPGTDLTLTDKTVLLEQIINHPPNTSHCQLAKITGVPKFTIACVIHQKGKLRDKWILCHEQQGASQKWKVECKAPDAEEVLSQWFSIVTEQDASVSSPMLKSGSEELART
jgi:hypothetical protein